jgi:WD40 repeat protein
MTLPEPASSWGISPDSQSILAVNLEGQVSEWKGPEFQQKTPLFTIRRPLPDRQELFSKDGRVLAAGSTNGILQVWDLQQRELRREWTNGGGEVRPEAFLAGNTKLVTSSSSDGLHHEVDLGSGRALQSWRWAAEFITCILSPDDRDCLSLGYAGDFVLRSLAAKSDRKLSLDGLEATSGGFSPDGSLFVMASDLGYARVWDTTTWRQVATLGGVLMGMNSASFSADGKRVVIASSGTEAVKLFDTESWEEVFTLAGLGFGLGGARFSPDGNTITWGNRAGDLYIWRAPSWEEISAAEPSNNSREPR